ncbi:MAG: membrane protein insertase YidC [Bacteroidetes bacterium]|nr:membrane protein insertase YidC [Bacteroidota bacterium]MDA0984304.1 membrane protein insertase YidC [Bacteroidota bacterium]
MEEKKFDPYQFIGFILIALILTWMLYRNVPAEESAKDPVSSEEVLQQNTTPTNTNQQNDSIIQQQTLAAYGDLGSLFVPNQQESLKLNTNEMSLEISPKGGQLSKLNLNQYENYEDAPIPMINEGNSDFNIEISTFDGRVIHTRDMFFSSSTREGADAIEVEMKASLGPQQYLLFQYRFPKKGYLYSLSFKTVGMQSIMNPAIAPKLIWKTDVFRNSRSIDYENRYTEYTFGYEEDRVDYLSLSGSDEETRQGIRWISYRQHFFSAILIPELPIAEAKISSMDRSSEEGLNEKFTKTFTTAYALNTGGDINTNLKFYYGPTDYKTLKQLDGDLETSIPMGWGIFGWINRVIFLPLFEFLSSFLSYGIAIIVMTVIVRLAMSPVTYKSYVSQIKMKVLRPDIEVINEKYKNDAVKRQQETMSLYSRAGANPMSGCVPALLQLPVFYALFSFFPVAFVLRDKSFLWADDLSSYDSILDLGFSIPFYGDHISLFPILASIAIFFYTQMTTGQQAMPQQPGMPNMKIIIYLMPLMMLFFFNNYASGLSLYYFVSNLLTILLMLVIKNYIIDDDKIHAKIEENKKKPKKAGGFSARLQKAMEEAEKQKNARK